jgi:hypothetical protein
VNYTKGEWKILESNLSDTFRIIGEHGWQVCEYIKTKGDAHLIAAAPKQNEALQAAKSVLLDIQQRESKTSFHGQRVASDCAEAIKVIDKALAKAEGRT